MSFRRFLKGPSRGRTMPSCNSDDQDVTITVDPNTNTPSEAWEVLSSRHTVRTVQLVDPSTPKPKGHTRFVCISDTHSELDTMVHLDYIPDGDVLLHAGDFTQIGTINEVRTFNFALGHTRFVCISDSLSRTDHMPDIPRGDVLLHTGNFSNLGMPREVKSFNEFLGKLPHRYKIVIAGNHEVTFDKQLMKERNSHIFMSFATALDEVENGEWEGIRDHLTNCIYLEDSEVRVLGFRIYGSPWTPAFRDWAFNAKRGQECLDIWNKIPNGIDILMTHGPPLGYGDTVSYGERAGCVELLNTVTKRVKPKYHVFGHIHEGYGVTSNGVTTFINASSCTVTYSPSNPPIVFDLPTPRVPVVEAESSV